MIKTGKAGSGTYGVVYKAETIDNKVPVAIKRNIMDETVNFSGSIKELDMLIKLLGHPYIVKLLSVSFGNPMITPCSPLPFDGHYKQKDDYLHFIFEQATDSCQSLINSPTVHYSYFKLCLFQLFLGLEYMHGKRIIHRDIKPANLLWFCDPNDPTKAAVKICDFGLSKIMDKGPMTPRVVTSWYRAPEICADSPSYTEKSDIWSAGCVMFEMIAKRAFLEGCHDNNVKLLSKIIGLSPDPSPEDILLLTSNNEIELTPDASPILRKTYRDLIGLTPEKIVDFNSFPESGASYDQFLDLLSKILVLNPEKRWSATQILNHEFFEPYRHIIIDTRLNYPPIPSAEHYINIVYCKERIWGRQIAFETFNNRGSLNWYNPRIIFQSIDLFDRYLTHHRGTTTHRLIESKYQGRYFTRNKAELIYYVCLYMAIKYFTTLYIPISFFELVSEKYRSQKVLFEAEEIEKNMLEHVFRYDIYRDTVYEKFSYLQQKKLNEYEIRDLLKKYGTIEKDTCASLEALTVICSSS